MNQNPTPQVTVNAETKTFNIENISAEVLIAIGQLIGCVAPNKVVTKTHEIYDLYSSLVDFDMTLPTSALRVSVEIPMGLKDAIQKQAGITNNRFITKKPQTVTPEPVKKLPLRDKNGRFAKLGWVATFLYTNKNGESAIRSVFMDEKPASHSKYIRGYDYLRRAPRSFMVSGIWGEITWTREVFNENR